MLRDGRSTLVETSGFEISPRRAGEPAKIDAVMLVEPAVLHHEKCLRQIGRHLGESEPFADDRAAPSDEVALLVQECVAGRTIERVQVGVHGQNWRGPGESEIDEPHQGHGNRTADNQRRQREIRGHTAHELGN